MSMKNMPSVAITKCRKNPGISSTCALCDDMALAVAAAQHTAQLLKSGVLISLRHLFAFLEVKTCNRDLSTVTAELVCGPTENRAVYGFDLWRIR